MGFDLDIFGVRLKGWWGIAALVALGAAVVAIAREMSRTQDPTRSMSGTIGGVVPYDLRPPTIGRVQRAVWDPENHNVVTPHAFGIGWGINLAEVSRRTGLLKRIERPEDYPATEEHMRETVREKLKEHSTAGFREVLASWHVRRGSVVDDAEAARLAEIYEAEAAAWRTNRLAEESAQPAGPGGENMPPATTPAESERLAS